jgi:hypothetical protein
VLLGDLTRVDHATTLLGEPSPPRPHGTNPTAELLRRLGAAVGVRLVLFVERAASGAPVPVVLSGHEARAS